LENWFNKEPRVKDSQTNRVEELANKLHRENRGHEIEAAIQTLSQNDLNEKERESLHHLLGIEAMRRHDWETAFIRFKEANRLFPASHMIRFSLGQEYERRGDVERAFGLFDGCSFPQMPAPWALAQSRYAYLWGFAERGAAYLRPIFDAYFKLGIVDDHFLYVRGLPFFGVTWNYMFCFAWMKRDFSEVDGLTERSASTLQDYNFDNLKLFGDVFKKADFGPYKSHLRSGIERASGQNWSMGFQKMQLAALESDAAQDFSSAENVIGNVELKPNDFPWLEDVRTILLAKMCHKHGRLETESQLKRKFLERQRMLFEPDHAVSFWLLDYQEVLKSEYVKTKRI
jgi:hypothetical protein